MGKVKNLSASEWSLSGHSRAAGEKHWVRTHTCTLRLHENTQWKLSAVDNRVSPKHGLKKLHRHPKRMGLTRRTSRGGVCERLFPYERANAASRNGVKNRSKLMIALMMWRWSLCLFDRKDLPYRIKVSLEIYALVMVTGDTEWRRIKGSNTIVCGMGSFGHVATIKKKSL